MKSLLIISILAIFSLANENYINMKKCETIQLSKLTALISCHKIDYLIEYRLVDDEEKDRVKKITAITQTDQRIIKNIGR